MRLLILMLWLSVTAVSVFAADRPAYPGRLGRWKTAGNVKELYQTPEGTVYRFEPSPHFADLHRPIYSNGKKHPDDCTCRTCRVKRNLNALQLPLKKRKPGRDDALFAVIEFKVRLFPALEKNQDPSQLALAFYFAENTAPGVNGDSLYQVFRISPQGVQQENLIHRYKAEMQERLYGRFYMPLFDWISVQMIVDISEHICRLYVNGALYQCIDLTKREDEGPKFNSIGLFIEMGKKRPTVFEVTRPRLSYLPTNNNALAAYPPTVCERYDYRAYEQGPRKRILTPEEIIAADRDNPDRYHAAAMKIMADPDADPRTALKYWQTAAKANHLPARYQLAVCQWRGMGMEPDPDKAIEMLREMPEYPPAAALAALIEWKQYPYPALPSRHLLDRTRRVLADQSGNTVIPAPDFQRLRSFCAGITPTLMDLRQQPALSLKQLLRLRPFPAIRHLTQQEINGFLPYNIPDDRLHSLDDAAFYRAVLTRALQAKMPLARQWMAEWLRSLALSGNAPDALLLEAAEAQLQFPEAQADHDCSLLRLQLRWERNQLTMAELDTPANRLRFRHDPTFALLQLALRYPDTPGLKDLRLGRTDRAVAIWRQDLSPECRMMLALVQWRAAMGTPPGFGSTVAGQPANRELWRETFQQLAEAAADQLPEAEIALARLSVELPPDAQPRPNRLYPLSTAIAKLNQAAGNGDPVAGMSLVNHYRRATGGTITPRVLPHLQTAAGLGDTEACRLLGESLLKTGRRQEALTWLNRAADTGDPAALAIIARQTTGDGAAAAWRRFVEADRQARLNDPLDFPEPELPVNQNILNGIPAWEDFAEAMKRRGRVQRYEDWKKWGRQSEGKIGGTSLSF